MQADDAITSSREELGFAVAQFGEAATSAFTGAVETAKAKMSEAFDLKQLSSELCRDLAPRRTFAMNVLMARLADDQGLAAARGHPLDP